MIQLQVVGGAKAGYVFAARRFPVRIGREPRTDLQLEDQGVWEHHLRIEFEREAGMVAHPRPEARTTINGLPVSEPTLLRHGDTVQLGGASLRFWFGPVRQRGLRLREWLVWSGLLAVSLGQVALVYWLLRE